ncbi:uracil-DNA glycosylase [Mariprofundus ferrinatatus]|uniref:uracil-DNA glycosylase n=1 Tax=Mariprofundus ferrinatatus TaxID=1921087 RepID=UPI001E5AC416|nr:uracil-DNA glycosylase [Mariprofundus ferrinatatus]
MAEPAAAAEKGTVPVAEGEVSVAAPAIASVDIPVVEAASGSLEDLARQASTCRLCSLADTRTNVVFGVGNPQADIVFIGEAPGRDEDIKGEPFVGRAGQLLDRMLTAIGMDREQVYIMNTIKCRPPNNRDPRVDEVQACNLWFEQQLELLQPKLICLLGRVAAQTVLETDSPLGSLRGRWHDYQGIPAWVTYHPAYLLRSPQQKQKSWQDLQALLSRHREIRG